MTEISTWVRNRVSADVDLDREAMVKLACEIVGGGALAALRAARRGRASTGSSTATRTSTSGSSAVDGQRTGYHDHDRSSGAVCVCEGMLYEDWFRVTGGSASGRPCTRRAGLRLRRRRHPRRPPPGAESPPPRRSTYSPALWRMGHYEPGPRGMRRTGITYADELLDACDLVREQDSAGTDSCRSDPACGGHILEASPSAP